MLMVGGVVVGIVIVVINLPPPLQVDEETLCPREHKTAGHTLVLVDWTDAYSEQQRRALRDIILTLRDDVQLHEQLSIHLITGNAEDAGAPRFTRCKPVELKNLNPLIHTWKRFHKRWLESFGEPLDKELVKLLQGGTAPQSPILESIEVIMWAHNFQGNLPSRRLVIVSDLLQNVPGHSHLTGSPPDPCAFLETPLGQRLKARNWDNIVVDIRYWPNSQWRSRQTPDHQRFWTQLFHLLGATQVFVDSRENLGRPNCAGSLPEIRKPPVGQKAGRDRRPAGPLKDSGQ
jgi:hypothetical protein